MRRFWHTAFAFRADAIGRLMQTADAVLCSTGFFDQVDREIGSFGSVD